MEKILDSLEHLVWLSCIPVIACSDQKKFNCTGCGFVLNYNNTLFFITAGHVANWEGYNTDKIVEDDNLLLISNKQRDKIEIGAYYENIGKPWMFKSYDLSTAFNKDELSEDDLFILSIPDRPDIAINLFNSENLRRPAGLTEDGFYFDEGPYCIIPWELQAIPKIEDTFLIYGSIGTISDTSVSFKKTMKHDDLTFHGKNSTEDYIFKPPFPIDYRYWSGLSGAPVFNNNGRWIGMLISANQNNDELTVLPPYKIQPFLKYIISHSPSIPLR